MSRLVKQHGCIMDVLSLFSRYTIIELKRPQVGVCTYLLIRMYEFICILSLVYTHCHTIQCIRYSTEIPFWRIRGPAAFVQICSFSCFIIYIIRTKRKPWRIGHKKRLPYVICSLIEPQGGIFDMGFPLKIKWSGWKSNFYFNI